MDEQIRLAYAIGTILSGIFIFWIYFAVIRKRRR